MAYTGRPRKGAGDLTSCARSTCSPVSACSSLSSRPRNAPNFVLFLADDISWDDLGYAGHPTIKTPHIDRLAARGMRFENAYLTNSSCSPSRCSLITGRYPHNTGAPELHTRLPQGQVLFPQLLKESGYHTVLSGKHHMGKHADPAFSLISKGKGPGKEADWVTLLAERPEGKPFFCWFASTDAHRNWAFNHQAPRYRPEEVQVPPYLVDGERTRQDLTGYYHEVSRFDHFVGAVTRELERQAVLDDTVILVMADNGRPFPRCKTRLYDSGIKTPFVVHYPRRVRPAVTKSLISTIDIAATCLDLAELPPAPSVQGVSFKPVLEDPAKRTRGVVFAEHNWHVYQSHERLVRTDDWLYIKNAFPERQNLCVEAYLGGAGEELWDTWRAGKLNAAQSNVFRKPCPAEELFFVGQGATDPHQLRNLAAEEQHAEALARMRELLAQWVRDTGDTVPADPTPDRDAPPGAPRKNRKGFRHREMPGASTTATKIDAKGPLGL